MSTSTSERKNRHAPQPASTTDAAETKKKMTPSEHRVQVAAARLRVTLDQRLGRPTPEKTKSLAKEDL